MNEQERALVMAFIEPARRGRYLLHLASAKHRPKILDRLNHWLDLRAGVAMELPSSLSQGAILAELRRRGAPATCHVIADRTNGDGQDLPLEEAVELAYGHVFGIVLCCIPGQLALYKPESPSPMHLLERRG